MKITNHHELRNRITIDCSEPKITDQSYKSMCDVNNIMANYAKTGMLSHTTTIQPSYIDNTLIPSLEHAHDIVNAATRAFYELPPTIRKLMDNNPQNLENFVQDPENYQMLEKHGILIQRQPKDLQKPSEEGSKEEPKNG